MTDQWLVLKFGGTSVRGKPEWERIAALAGQRLADGYRVVLVCSAVAGVTDALQSLVGQTEDRARQGLDEIMDRHRALADSLGVDADDLLQQAGEVILQALSVIAAAEEAEERDRAIATLLPVGEWLSTRIGERYLAQQLPVEWVDVREALTALPEPDAGRRIWLSARCHNRADPALIARWAAQKPLLITQGFVVGHPEGGTVLLGRGGSDTSAALLASRLNAGRIEIWTDVPGLFSADPRRVPGARLLQSLSYDEALEMAASGAKVVHPRCIRAAAGAGIPVVVRDLAQPGFDGTRIHADDEAAENAEGVRAICLQSNMAVLLLQNLDARAQVGFLAWVFSRISEAGVSVDLVATSETTTTLAINKTSNQLDETGVKALAARLRERCAVTLYPDCSGINLVGRGVRMGLGHVDPQSDFFADRPLLMLSQSANDLCLSLLLRNEDAAELLGALHRTLVEARAAGSPGGGVFGPGWREIQQG